MQQLENLRVFLLKGDILLSPDGELEKSAGFKEWSLPQLIHCCPTLLPTTSTTVATASETAQASQGTPASGSFFFHIFLENRALEIIEIIAFDHFHCLQVSLRAC